MIKKNENAFFLYNEPDFLKMIWQNLYFIQWQFKCLI